jgi:uncharacterized protein YlaI
MRLKVICQICEEVNTIETRDLTHTSDWRFYEIKNHLDILYDRDLGVWLCPSCSEDLDSWDNYSTESFFGSLIDSLNLHESDVANRDLKCLINEGYVLLKGDE